MLSRQRNPGGGTVTVLFLHFPRIQSKAVEGDCGKGRGQGVGGTGEGLGWGCARGEGGDLEEEGRLGNTATQGRGCCRASQSSDPSWSRALFWPPPALPYSVWIHPLPPPLSPSTFSLHLGLHPLPQPLHSLAAFTPGRVAAWDASLNSSLCIFFPFALFRVCFPQVQVAPPGSTPPRRECPSELCAHGPDPASLCLQAVPLLRHVGPTERGRPVDCAGAEWG